MNTLRSNGFELGARNPALYRSDLVNGFCHGDDFVTAAAEGVLEIFGTVLHEKFDRVAQDCQSDQQRADGNLMRI